MRVDVHITDRTAVTLYLADAQAAETAHVTVTVTGVV